MGKNTEGDERKYVRTDLINFLMFKSELNISLYILYGSKGRRRTVVWSVIRASQTRF